MKKLFLVSMALAMTAPAFAWHYGPRYHHYHRHCCGYSAGDCWAAAGVGLVGGLVGGAILANAVKPDPPPVAVQQPVVVQSAPVVVQQQPVVVQQPAPQVVQNVWVEGRYVNQPQPNGTVVRVWQPGHYEQ